MLEERLLPERNKPLIIPEALQQVLQEDKLFGEAFERLNLTQKREFSELIATAKREATQAARMEKDQAHDHGRSKIE